MSDDWGRTCSERGRAVAESSGVPAKPAKRRGTAGGNREEKRNGQQREYIIFGRPVLQ